MFEYYSCLRALCLARTAVRTRPSGGELFGGLLMLILYFGKALSIAASHHLHLRARPQCHMDALVQVVKAPALRLLGHMAHISTMESSALWYASSMARVRAGQLTDKAAALEQVRGRGV